MPSRNPWPVVVIMAVSVVAVTALALVHADTSILVGLIGATILPVVTMIYGSVEQTRTQTNGNNSQLVQLVQSLTEKLYASTPTIGGNVPAGVALPGPEGSSSIVSDVAASPSGSGPGGPATVTELEAP